MTRFWSRRLPDRLAVLCLISITLGAFLVAGCGDDGDEPATTAAVATTTTTASPTTTADTTSTTASPTTMTSTTTTEADADAGDDTVSVWFSTGDGSNCAEVTRFVRAIGPDADPYRAAFEALVAGPTSEEEAAGASSFFSSSTVDLVDAVQRRDDGLLIVDLADLSLSIPNASTSCGSSALTAQLDATAFQFPDVDRVRYRMLGSCDLFANFLQGECIDRGRNGQDIPVPTEERASGSGCVPPAGDGLPDGRWYGLVDEARSGDLTFDLACWFSGTAAEVAATEDGEESPPPNDYYVRNESDRLRTLPLGDAVDVTWYPDGGDPANVATVGYDQWRTDRDARAFDLAVWLVIENDVVVAVEEQWVP